MTTDWAFAYLSGAVAALLSLPAGWAIATPAGWAVTAALIDRGRRP